MGLGSVLQQESIAEDLKFARAVGKEYSADEILRVIRVCRAADSDGQALMAIMGPAEEKGIFERAWSAVTPDVIEQPIRDLVGWIEENPVAAATAFAVVGGAGVVAYGASGSAAAGGATAAGAATTASGTPVAGGIAVTASSTLRSWLASVTAGSATQARNWATQNLSGWGLQNILGLVNGMQPGGQAPAQQPSGAAAGISTPPPDLTAKKRL